MDEIHPKFPAKPLDIMEIHYLSWIFFGKIIGESGMDLIHNLKLCANVLRGIHVRLRADVAVWLPPRLHEKKRRVTSPCLNLVIICGPPSAGFHFWGRDLKMTGGLAMHGYRHSVDHRRANTMQAHVHVE